MNNLTFIPIALAEARDVVLYVRSTSALIAAGSDLLRRHHINQVPARSCAGFSLPDETSIALAYHAQARLSFAAIL